MSHGQYQDRILALDAIEQHVTRPQDRPLAKFALVPDWISRWQNRQRIAGRDDHLDDIDRRYRIVLLDVRQDVAEIRAGLVGPTDNRHHSAQLDGPARALDDFGRALTEPFGHVIVII